MIDTQTPPIGPNYIPVDANGMPPMAGYDAQTQPPVLPLEEEGWSSDQAKKIVLGDFQRAQSDRLTNFEPDWQEAAQIYLATNRGEKFWEGTRTPRANMEIHHAYQQIAALRPRLLDAICGSDLDFDVEAAASGTTFQQLLLVRRLMEYYLRSLGGRVRFQTFRYIVDRLTEDGLIYGNGICEWGWDGPRTEQVVKWQRFAQPEMQMGIHPQMGIPMPMPTGRTVSWAEKNFTEKRVSQFFLDPVDLMDFYIDPNTRGTNCQMAGYAIRRKMMTIEEISSYRGMDGWDIPDDKTLYAYSQRKYSTEGDTTKQIIASARGENYQPQMDQSVDPRLARVEVLRYWQHKKHVWLIAREHTAYNTVNQYQAIPFFNWCYSNAPGAFWGLSLPKLVRTDQKLIKTLVDGRLDELNLILHPPFVTKIGMARSQSKMKMRPGANWEAEDPQKDVLRLEMSNVTQNAYVEVNEAENRSQKKTGITDLAILGSPTAGGNSANRTATGVTAQTSASNAREHGLVANQEDQVYGPMLNVLWTLICMFVTPEEAMEILGPEAQQYQLDGVDVLNSDPKFNMKTANRMKMRAVMQNGGLNTVLQFFLNPETVTMAAEQQNKTPDFEAISELVCDVNSLKAFQFYRTMSPQEQQAAQQRQHGPMQAKMALQQARIQQMSSDAQDRDETQIMVALIQGLAQAGLLHLASGIEAPVQLEARKLDAEIAGGNTGPAALQLAQQAQQQPEANGN